MKLSSSLLLRLFSLSRGAAELRAGDLPMDAQQEEHGGDDDEPGDYELDDEHGGDERVPQAVARVQYSVPGADGGSPHADAA